MPLIEMTWLFFGYHGLSVQPYLGTVDWASAYINLTCLDRRVDWLPVICIEVQLFNPIHEQKSSSSIPLGKGVRRWDKFTHACVKHYLEKWFCKLMWLVGYCITNLLISVTLKTLMCRKLGDTILVFICVWHSCKIVTWEFIFMVLVTFGWPDDV